MIAAVTRFRAALRRAGKVRPAGRGALIALAGLFGLSLVAGVFSSCKGGVECLKTVRGTTISPCGLARTSSSVMVRSTACFDAPEICPDLSPVRFCAQPVESDSVVNVLLLNRGEKPLSIRSIKVRGDTRCAFQDPQLSPKLEGTRPAVVDGRGELVLRFHYRPPSPGEDHIAIEVTNDSDNLPTLLIPVCGQGVNARAGTDGGSPDATNPRNPGPGCLPCQDRSNEPFTTCWDAPSSRDGGV